MLWTDAQFISQMDMARVDSEVIAVAASDESPIDINGDTIPTTIDECGTDILVDMQRFGGFLSSGLVSANHLAAVFNVGGPGVNRTRISLGMIVVDDPQGGTAIKRWVMYRALRNFYRDAFARTKDDRYFKKMEQYQKDAQRKYQPQMQALGIPIVYKPFPAPGAIQERSGFWGSANITQYTPGATTGGTFWVTITWVDQSQYLGNGYGLNSGNANQGESYWAAPQEVIVPAGNAICVNTNGLIPPNGVLDPARLGQVIVTPSNATAFNVYVSASATGPFFLQNVSPVQLANSPYQLAGDPVLSGPQPNPQFTDCFYTVQPMLQRG